MPVLEQAPRRVRTELRSPYQVVGMRLRLQKLQAKDQEARKVREVSESKQGLKDGWEENANVILIWEGLPISPPNLWVFDFDYTLVGACALEERQLNSTTTSNTTSTSTPNSNCWPVSTIILSFRSSTRPGAKDSDYPQTNASVLAAIAMWISGGSDIAKEWSLAIRIRSRTLMRFWMPDCSW